MSELVADILIVLGGVLVAVVALLQTCGVYVISRETEQRKIATIMQEGKDQSEAQKIIQDRNTRIIRIYAALTFIGAIMMALGGLCK